MLKHPAGKHVNMLSLASGAETRVYAGQFDLEVP